MNRKTCEIGDQFGYWTVIDNVSTVKRGHAYVKVKCICGRIQDVCLSDLISGRATGCRSCKARERSRNVHIGDTYKKWTVVGGPIVSKHHVLLWRCRCACGNERVMQGNELTNPNKCFACQKCAAVERGLNFSSKGRVGDLTQNRYTKLQKNATSRNIPFEVSKEFLWKLYLKQDRKCAITGDILPSISKASLDRIDSSKGYIEGNVQWVTVRANLSKHTMTMAELYDFCKKVLSHANQQPSQPLTKLEGSETNS